MDYISHARLAISSLTVYRGILKNPAVKKYADLLEAVHGADVRNFVDAYCGFYYVILSSGKSSVTEYIDEIIENDDNAFTAAASRGGRDAVPIHLYKAAEHDMSALKSAVFAASSIKEAAEKNFCEESCADIIRGLPEWETSPIKKS